MEVKFPIDSCKNSKLFDHNISSSNEINLEMLIGRLFNWLWPKFRISRLINFSIVSGIEVKLFLSNWSFLSDTKSQMYSGKEVKSLLYNPKPIILLFSTLYPNVFHVISETLGISPIFFSKLAKTS